MARTPWDEKAAGAQALVAHTAGVAVPITGGHGQDAVELVGEVSVGQDAAAVEGRARRHLQAIPQPGHADGTGVEASDMANKQQLGWAGAAGEDCGHRQLWGMRPNGWGKPRWATAGGGFGVWGGFGVAVAGSGWSHLVSPESPSHTSSS